MSNNSSTTESEQQSFMGGGDHHSSMDEEQNNYHEQQQQQQHEITSSNRRASASSSSYGNNSAPATTTTTNLWSHYFKRGKTNGKSSSLFHSTSRTMMLMTPSTFIETRRKIEEATKRNIRNSRDNDTWKLMICIIVCSILIVRFMTITTTTSTSSLASSSSSTGRISQSSLYHHGSANNNNNSSFLSTATTTQQVLPLSTSFNELVIREHKSHGPTRSVENIPDIYNNLVDIDVNFMSTINSNTKNFGLQVPLFWHVPRSGGTTIKEILSKCLGLVMASDINTVLTSEEKVLGGYGSTSTSSSNNNQYLQTVFVKHHGKYVNVDTTTVDGLQHASDLNLVASTMSQVIVSPLAYEAMEYLFDSKSWTRGILFTIIRDPIERASSLYYYRHYVPNTSVANSNTTTSTTTTTITTNDESFEEKEQQEHIMKSMKEYFSSPNQAENNWMTRILLNKKVGPLYLEDLDLAKEILKRKCLIGLMTHKEASLRRFIQYFKWHNYYVQPGVSECQEKLLFWGWANKKNNDIAPIDDTIINEGTNLYNLIKRHNEFDIELYEYAKELYEEQAKIFILDTTTSNNNSQQDEKQTISSQTQQQQQEEVVPLLPPATNIRKGEGIGGSLSPSPGDEGSSSSNNNNNNNNIIDNVAVTSPLSAGDSDETLSSSVEQNVDETGQ